MLRFISRLMSSFRNLARKNRVDRDLDEEIQSQLALITDQKIGEGMPADKARRAATIELGGVEQVKEQVRAVRAGAWLDSFARDVRFALRMLRKSPGFTAVAIVTLALGIGANTAIFSIVNAVLVRPLPFRDSAHLVRLWDSYGHRGVNAPVSYPNFADWRAWSQSFSGMAAYAGEDYVLTGHGEPVHLHGVIASAGLFQVFGIQPVLGRSFVAEEDNPHADSGGDAVILSFKTWTEVFQRDPRVIGQGITFDGKPFVIVGIAPAGVESLMGNGQAQFWTTVAPLAELSPESPKPLSEERQMAFLSVVGRLKPGFGLAQAQADMDHVAAELEHAYPEDDSNEGVTINGLQESMTGNVRPLLLILLAAVGLVLLIACANVTALILARTSSRQREMAVRAALGASGWRIAEQLLIECALLAFIGGAAGLWLAAVAKDSLVEILGVGWLATVPLDGRVLGFALLVTVVSSLIFGLAPALRSAKPDLIGTMKEGGHGAGESRRLQRLRQALVVGEVALAVALLSAAGLLAHSLINLQSTNPGFDPTRVLTFPVSLPQQHYPQARWSPFFAELTTRLRAIPGVVSASAAGAVPLAAGGESLTVLDDVAGWPIPMNQRRGIAFVPVTPDFFGTLRIPIKAGREFTEHDTNGSEPVVILNEAAVRKYFGNENAVGQQVEPLLGDGAGSKTAMRTVVGVVGDVKYDTLAQPAEPTIYWPLAQIPSNSTMYVAVRTSIDPTFIVGGARAQLHAMDKSLPMFDVWSLDHYLDQTLSQPRYNTLLMSSFAFLAHVLTTVGIYGTIAYAFAQRTHEIGVRIAMGAQRRDILKLVVGQGIKLALIGGVIGIIGAVGATRFLSGLLYGVGPTDPLTIILVSVVLTSVAFVACYIPARRAMRVDPMVALRHE